MEELLTRIWSMKVKNRIVNKPNVKTIAEITKMLGVSIGELLK